MSAPILKALVSYGSSSEDESEDDNISAKVVFERAGEKRLSTEQDFVVPRIKIPRSNDELKNDDVEESSETVSVSVSARLGVTATGVTGTNGCDRVRSKSNTNRSQVSINTDSQEPNTLRTPRNASADHDSGKHTDVSKNLPKERTERTASTGLLPPVPSNITAMYRSQEDEEAWHDDASKHGGRQRTFQHVRGNWATFLYIPAGDNQIESLHDLAEMLVELLPSDQKWSVCDDFHVSVSRTVTIRHHWMDPLINSLREKLVHIPSFVCGWDSVDVYTNDEKTRSFLSFKVGYGHSELLDVVKEVDDCFTEFKLPVYYKPPSFHVSLCWALGDVTMEISPAIRQKIKETYDQYTDSCDDLNGIYSEEIFCKTGNKIFKIPLCHR